MPSRFAALYSSASRSKCIDEDVNDDAVEVADQEHWLAGEEQLGLQLGHGFEGTPYSKRRKERILKYVHYKLRENPEAYYREQLLLFYPRASSTSDPVALCADEDTFLFSGSSTFDENRYKKSFLSFGRIVGGMNSTIV